MIAFPFPSCVYVRRSEKEKEKKEIESGDIDTTRSSL